MSPISEDQPAASSANSSDVEQVPVSVPSGGSTVRIKLKLNHQPSKESVRLEESPIDDLDVDSVDGALFHRS